MRKETPQGFPELPWTDGRDSRTEQPESRLVNAREYREALSKGFDWLECINHPDDFPKFKRDVDEGRIRIKVRPGSRPRLKQVEVRDDKGNVLFYSDNEVVS
jgi:hypothetical protein